MNRMSPRLELFSALLLHLVWTAQAPAAERNVALASEGAVAVADSEYVESPSQSGGERIKAINDGRWIGPGDRPESNRWHAALDAPIRIGSGSPCAVRRGFPAW